MVTACFINDFQLATNTQDWCLMLRATERYRRTEALLVRFRGRLALLSDDDVDLLLRLYGIYVRGLLHLTRTRNDLFSFRCVTSDLYGIVGTCFDSRERRLLYSSGSGSMARFIRGCVSIVSGGKRVCTFCLGIGKFLSMFFIVFTFTGRGAGIRCRGDYYFSEYKCRYER